MKRKALIIGNSGDKNNPKEYLEGVKKDVTNYNNFLQSSIGGKWYDYEIVLSLDETKNEVLKKISSIKQEQNDFVFILFSGHGSYSSWKECRKLYLFDEYLYEDNLTYLAHKQVTILDTCAGIENDLLTESMESFAMDNTFRKALTDYRKKYENEISECPNQQAILYSSSIDESSNDDSELGGYFAYSLLNIAKRNQQNILNCKEAYFHAKEVVQKKTNNEQNPQSKLIKSDNILPFSLKK